MQQSFNERLQNQILECEKEKQLRDNKRVEEVETAIIELQKKINEK